MSNFTDIKKKEELVSAYFPLEIREAVESVLRFCPEKLLEIHICRGSASSLRFISKRIYLGISVSQSDIDGIISSFTGRALYAYRNTLKDGFLTLEGGIRVGVCGQARYEGKSLVGVSDVSSLLIRLPSDECTFVNKLYEAFCESKRGMLIFAPSAGGKTTALRALVKRLAEKKEGRISLIDERREIDAGDFSRLDVDVFCGYRRAEGMQIALRVMSPQILAVDEIGTEKESAEMMESLLSGVRFIATAHARSYDELCKRKNLAPFFELEVFDSFVRIFKREKEFDCEIIRK